MTVFSDFTMEKMKQLVRLCDADLKGDVSIYYALTKIKGISYSISNAICKTLNLDVRKKVGLLEDDELNKIKEVMKDPLKYGMKPWMLNRNKDYDTGENKHLISSDLKLRKEFDIKIMKEIRSYKGLRHAYGLPTRGQRTRAHFRKGATVGVKKSKAAKKGRI